jgi:hypothetical protein
VLLLEVPLLRQRCGPKAADFHLLHANFALPPGCGPVVEMVVWLRWQTEDRSEPTQCKLVEAKLQVVGAEGDEGSAHDKQ